MDLKEWSDENEKIIRGPYSYLSKIPGKDIRPVLISSFNAVLKVPQDKLAIISDVIEMLHTASLLIDDVEDSATLRRGMPVANSLFGSAQTINSANYIMFVALQKIFKLDEDSSVKIFVEEMTNLHRGQGLDLYWRDTYHCPTEEEYTEMVVNKTGGLYRLAVRLMQSVSPVDVDLVPLANLLGAMYQVQDDYLNLQSDKYSTNKGFCEDITEGKFSFPVIHSVRADKSNKEIINILKQRTTDVALKEYAVNYMKNTTKSFEYTKTVIAEYEKQIRAMLAELHEHDTNAISAIVTRMLAIG